MKLNSPLPALLFQCSDGSLEAIDGLDSKPWPGSVRVVGSDVGSRMGVPVRFEKLEVTTPGGVRVAAARWIDLGSGAAIWERRA